MAPRGGKSGRPRRGGKSKQSHGEKQSDSEQPGGQEASEQSPREEESKRPRRGGKSKQPSRGGKSKRPRREEASGQSHGGEEPVQPLRGEVAEQPQRGEEPDQPRGQEEPDQPRREEEPQPMEPLELADPKSLRHEAFYDDRPQRVVWDEIKEQTKATYRIETFMSNVPVDQRRHNTDAYKLQRIKAAYLDNLNYKKTSGEPKVLPTPITLDHFLVDPAYKPPIGRSGRMERVKHVDDLSQIAPEKVPVRVFCDIGKHSTDHMFSHSFTYSKENFYRDKGNDPLAKLILKCDCKGQCKPETCGCMQAQQKAFPDVKHIGYGLVLDDFNYHKAHRNLNYYENALIVCGDLCGCDPKKCTNHVQYFKNIPHTIEVFRRNEMLGFGVRTLNNIRFDQIVSEFTGTVVPGDNVVIDPRRWNYAVEVGGDEAGGILKKLCEISKYKQEEFDFWQYSKIKEEEMPKKKKRGRRGKRTKKEAEPNETGDGKEGEQQEEEEVIVEWSQRDPKKKYQRVARNRGYYIDPYRMGNVSRFVTHGCSPNVIPVRIIANYLHPKYHRIFFKALHHIPAGSELFFNYGLAYVERAGFKCQCGTIFCDGKTKEEKQFFENMTHKQLLAALLQIRLNLVKVMHAKEDEYRKREVNGSLRDSVITLDSDGEEDVEEVRVNPFEIYKENPETARHNRENNRRYIGQTEETETLDRIAEREHALRRHAEILEDAKKAERFYSRERKERVETAYYHRDPNEMLREEGFLDGEDPQRAEMEALGYTFPFNIPR